jgi:hypothetical protein
MHTSTRILENGAIIHQQVEFRLKKPSEYGSEIWHAGVLDIEWYCHPEFTVDFSQVHSVEPLPERWGGKREPWKPFTKA